VRLELGRTVHKFSVDRVLYLSVHGNGDGLLHFIAYHFANPFFSVVPFHRNYF